MIHIEIDLKNVEILHSLIAGGMFPIENKMSDLIIFADNAGMSVDADIDPKYRDDVSAFYHTLKFIASIPKMSEMVPDEVFDSMYKIPKKRFIEKLQAQIGDFNELADSLEIQLTLNS